MHALPNMATLFKNHPYISMAVYCGQYYQNIFSWAKYEIFMGKHKFQWPKSQHMFSWSIYVTPRVHSNVLLVTLWQTHFHGQSATFSWAKYAFMGKLVVGNKMVMGRSSGYARLPHVSLIWGRD